MWSAPREAERRCGGAATPGVPRLLPRPRPPLADDGTPRCADRSRRGAGSYGLWRRPGRSCGHRHVERAAFTLDQEEERPALMSIDRLLQLVHGLDRSMIDF